MSHEKYCWSVKLFVDSPAGLTSSHVIPADEAFRRRLTIFKSDFLAVPSGLNTRLSLIVTFNRNLERFESQ